MRLTILSENTVSMPFGIIGEHGLSVFIETEKLNFLFDTGQGKTLLNNAIVLKKDLGSIRFLCLSHGHYDHTGGIVDLLNFISPLDVYAHPDIFINRFWMREGKKRFIGIPFKKTYLETLGAHFKFVKNFTEIEHGIYLSGEIERINSFEKIDNQMKMLDETGSYVQDEIYDDFSLAIDTEKGLIVLLGCAHAGIVNILDHFIKKLSKNEIYAVIGGTHLAFADDEQIEKTVKTLDRYNIKKLGASHCTGLEVSAKLHEKLKDRFFFASAGSSLEI